MELLGTWSFGVGVVTRIPIDDVCCRELVFVRLRSALCNLVPCT